MGGKEPSMLTILKPIIIVNQLLGVCPHEISGDILIFRWTSIKVFKTLFNMCILLCHVLFTTFQFARALIARQDMVQLGFLLSWMIGPLISLLILVVTIQKRDDFTEFFIKLHEFKASVCMKGITNCQQMVNFAWRFYAFYMCLALSCAVLVGWDTLVHPQSAAYFLYYVPDPSHVMISLNCFYQFYLVIITQSACALIEVHCASISYSIANKINKIHTQMKTGLGQMNETCTEIMLSRGEKPGQGLPFYRTVQAQLSSGDMKQSPTEYSALPDGVEDVEYATSTGPIMKAIKRFSYIAQKQRLINCIFGPILALDIAWLVIHVCLLFFLQIKSLGPAAAAGVVLDDGDLFRNKTLNGIGMETDRVALHAGQGIIFLVRLLIVLISLGNVHEYSRWFDNEVAGSLMAVKEPKPSDINLIQVHLLGNQANPVSFSAGGFFVVSRGTLLYAFSIITTYIVFMLQA